MRLVALLVATLLLAGCTSRDAPGTDGGDDGGAAPPPAATPPPETKLSVTSQPPYAYAPKELAAPAGATVNLTLVNQDPLAQHNWVLDEAGATTDAIPNGQSTNVVFVAPAAGSYTFYCSVGNHRQLGMVGTFTAT